MKVRLICPAVQITSNFMLIFAYANPCMRKVVPLIEPKGFLKLFIYQEMQMTRLARTSMLLSVTTSAIMLAFSINASAAIDVDAAKALARENNCFKCHAIEKEKDGPAFKKVAEKYRGKANAEGRLVTHLTSGEKAKFPDGHEENHKIIKTKDMGEIKNLVNWILSL